MTPHLLRLASWQLAQAAGFLVRAGSCLTFVGDKFHHIGDWDLLAGSRVPCRTSCMIGAAWSESSSLYGHLGYMTHFIGDRRWATGRTHMAFCQRRSSHFQWPADLS